MEKLQKANEKLQQILRGRLANPNSRTSWIPRVNVDPQPFTQKIMVEQVLPHFMVLKLTLYLGSRDPETHLKGFRAQMLISGGSDVIRCKMFVGTLTGMTLQGFSTIPDGTIDSFQTFFQLFLQQFATNQVKPPKDDRPVWYTRGRAALKLSQPILWNYGENRSSERGNVYWSFCKGTLG